MFPLAIARRGPGIVKKRRRYTPGEHVRLEERLVLSSTALTSQAQQLAVPNVSASEITFPELDQGSAPFAVRIDTTTGPAAAIRLTVGDTVALAFDDPGLSYQVMTNQPTIVQAEIKGGKLVLTALSAGFCGIKVNTTDQTRVRYLGFYAAEKGTGFIPDTINGYVPVGSISSLGAGGNEFFEQFNFQPGVAPIDYDYIYVQGGAKVSDGNLTGLLQQAAEFGMVPVIVFYNIQATNAPGYVEGPTPAFQAINDFDTAATGNYYQNYMLQYFNKLKATLATIRATNIPTQIVMEPDFLGYMATATLPAGFPTKFVNSGDRTQNSADVFPIYQSGLLTPGVDPDFPNTVAGLVQAINDAVAKNAPNVRIGWKTNVWAVPDQRNYSLGLMHVTDSVTYPWQGQWTGPLGWADGRAYIISQAAQLATFLKNVGVLKWPADNPRKPFLAIDKYGVDGAYIYDPAFLSPTAQTAAYGNLWGFVQNSYLLQSSLTEAASETYFGMSKSDFLALCNRYSQGGTLVFDKSDPQVVTLFTNLQNAAKADPNIAPWFWNADQWNNYLLFVSTLSKNLDNTKVMLWQIPQGHINGSTLGMNLSDTDSQYEDSATDYFFGDTFTVSPSQAAFFGENNADDPSISVSPSGDTVTWGNHFGLAGQSGVMSVLFGAGLGVSTRGSPTPAGGITDQGFWVEKATAYLKTEYRSSASNRSSPALDGYPVTANPSTWPTVSLTAKGRVMQLNVTQPNGLTYVRDPFANRQVSQVRTALVASGRGGAPEIAIRGLSKQGWMLRVLNANTLKPMPAPPKIVRAFAD